MLLLEKQKRSKISGLKNDRIGSFSVKNQWNGSFESKLELKIRVLSIFLMSVLRVPVKMSRAATVSGEKTDSYRIPNRENLVRCWRG